MAADRLEAYADWLVKNQNKRGTPEFDTVANAYREMRSQPDSSLITGMQNRALRIGQGIVDLPQTALDAMTGMEDTRLLVGNNEPGFQMSDLVPRFAPAEQADAMGYTDNPFGFDGYEFKEAADYLERSADALNYQPAIPWDQVKQDPSPKNIIGFMGETAVTSLPDMAAALLSSPAYFASYIAPIANERAANDGGRAVTPADLAFASVAAATIAQAEKVGAKAIFGKQAGQTVKGRIGKAAGKEAATEAIQNPVEYAGGTVGTQAGFDPAVAADQALAGIVGGGGSGAGLRGTVEVAGGTARLFGAGGNTPTDPEGAADLARRLQGIAQENGLNLKDIDKTSTKGAREAVDKAHVQLAEELKQVGRDLRQRLGITDTDELSVVLDKVLAAAGQREARNKTKNTVGKQEFEAITRLTGDTTEGQQMLRLMRQMNELTELHNSGYQGGVSRLTDQLMPFGTNIGYDRGAVATERLLRPLVSGGAAIQTGGASLAGQAALAGAGRAIDAVTGRRSRVKRFVEQNAAKPGVQADPNATSLRDERRQQVLAAQEEAAKEQQRRDQARARSRAMHAEVLAANAEYPSGERISPQQIMVDELGMSPQQVVRALKSLVTDPTYGPAARSAIRSFQRGGNIEALGMLIKKLERVMAGKQPPAMRDRPIKKGGLAVYQAQEAQRSAAVQQGIRDNQALNDQLQAALDADNTVSEGDRQIAKRTLEKLRMDLTRAPLQTAEAYLQDALNRASDPGVITKYVLPYVERVRVQQNAKAASEAPTTTEGMSAEPEINQMAVPDFGEGLSIFPKTRKLFRAIDSMDVPEGQYVADGENVTGQTYNGARVYIGPNGRPKMEVDPDQVGEPTKQLGKRWYSNAVRPDRYKMVENPTGHEGSIVAVEDSSKHYFAVQYEADVPTELYRKPLKKDGTEAPQPTMRPRGFGIIKPGKEIGKIKIAGRVHPLYDTIRIEPEGEPEINQMSSTFEGVNDPMRISPRKPTGANATEDALAEDLQIDASSLLNSPRLGDKVRGIVDSYVGLQGSRREGDTRPPEERFIEHVKSNLLHLYNAVSPEYRERAKQWYVGANKLSSEAAARFDLTLPQVSGVMAALSPQKDWYMNYDLGVRTIDVFMNAQDQVFSPKMAKQMRAMIEKQSAAQQQVLRKTLNRIKGKKLSELQGLDQAIFVRFYDQANNPERGHRVVSPEGELLDFQRKKDGTKSGTAWNGFRDIAKAISIIQNGSRENISEQLGDMHKVRSFYNNILNPMSDRGDVTIDTHAVAAGMMKPLSGKALEVGHNFNTAGKSAITGAKGTYGLYAEAYRQAAAEVGVLPREMQSITWEAVRGLFSPQFKGQQTNVDAIENIWKRYDEGTISIEQAREEIFDVAGNIDGAAWEAGSDGSSGSGARSTGRSGNAGELPGAGVSGRGDDAGALGQPAGILHQSSIDFDGTGDNGQLGRAPGLADSPVAGSREPTPTEVEQASRTVKAAFEIGKPGSEFENGVPDIETAKKIAEAINVAVHIAGTPATTAKHLGKKLGTNIVPSRIKGTAGYQVATEDSPTPSGRGIGIHTKEIPGKSPGYQLYVMLHELGHVFESSPADPNDPTVQYEVQTRTLAGFENVSGITGEDNIRRPLRFDTEAEAKAEMAEQMDDDPSLDLRVRKAYENVGNEVYSPTAKKVIPIDGIGSTFTGTFRDVLRQVLNVSGGEKADLKISQKDAEDIIKEIIAVQRTGVLQGDARRYLMASPGQASIEKAPNQFEADFTNVRTDYYLGKKLVRRGALTQGEMDSTLGGAERTYFHTPHELAADLLGLYMLDPAGTRAMMPKAARLARLVFRDNPTIQFFSLPFASIVAMVLANMLVAEGEEEDMDPGALSMGAGALTA